MNSYTLIKIADYPKTSFYSIVEENQNEELIWFAEFMKKIKRHDAISIRKMIQEIGKKYGARKQYFRHENRAHALPSAEVRFIETDKSLRLYCLRLSDQAVILFNGGYKDAQTAQESGISYHFQEANIMANKIQKALINNEIRENRDGRLEWDDDLML